MAPIDLALKYLQSWGPEEKISYIQIAKNFGVDRSTLSRRYRQVTGSQEDKYYAQALLNKDQSAVLITLVKGHSDKMISQQGKKEDVEKEDDKEEGEEVLLGQKDLVKSAG